MAQRIDKPKGTNVVDIEGLEDLKPGSGVNGYEYGMDLKTDGVRLEDEGIGKTVSIRTFHYKMNPELRKNFPADKQMLFNAHAQHIKTVLWGDGLVPLEGHHPRIMISKKKGVYAIIVPCEARVNVMWMEKAQTLQDIMKARSTSH